MSHQIVTPEAHNDMPHQPGLLRRKSRYSINIKVPKDLCPHLNKEHIREALGTSDRSEAIRLAKHLISHWQAFFDEERRKLKASVPNPSEQKRLILNIKRTEAQAMAQQYLIQKEAEWRDWWDKESLSISPPDQQELMISISMDMQSLTEGVEGYEPNDGGLTLRHFLEEREIECPESSPAYTMLRPMFRSAALELTRRKLDQLEGNPIKEHDALFRNVHAFSPQEDTLPGISISELVAQYLKVLKTAEAGDSTFSASVMPFRVVTETLGPKFPVSAIDDSCMQRLCDILRKVPVNATKRYPKLSIPEAISDADAKKDVSRIAKRTQKNYFNIISGLFKYAEDSNLLARNPAKNRFLKKAFTEIETTPVIQFSVEELNRLFRAPLYTGCMDDQRGYAKVGPNKPRRGRFWVPLLSVFHGLRLNEACQLHTSDIKNFEDITYIAVCLDDSQDDAKKRLKTKKSKRNIPLHPMLINLGFLEYVEQRRKDTESVRLFPELRLGAKGNYSDSFSKWFGRFVDKALGLDVKATFHSSRHKFRDATRIGRLPIESIGLLGGWSTGSKESSLPIYQYGKADDVILKILAEDITKIDYPGLDLTHLYRQKNAEVASKKRVIRDR